MSGINTFIANNWKGILTVFGAIVVGFSGYRELQVESATTKRRVQTYIDVIKAQEKTIHNLDKRVAVLEATKCK